MDSPPPPPPPPPAVLPPRRPVSMPELGGKRFSWQNQNSVQWTRSNAPPPFLPPRRPSSAHVQQVFGIRNARPVAEHSSIRRLGSVRSHRSSLEAIQDEDSAAPAETNLERISSDRRRPSTRLRARDSTDHYLRRPCLQTLLGGEQIQNVTGIRQLPLRRHSSLRIEHKLPEDVEEPGETPHGLGTTKFEPSLFSNQKRPCSHPPAVFVGKSYATKVLPHSLPLNFIDTTGAPPNSTPPSPASTPNSARPRASFRRLSSLDNFITYREELAAWKRESSIYQDRFSDGDGDARVREVLPAAPTGAAIDELSALPTISFNEKTTSFHISEESLDSTPERKNNFRHIAGEIAFCFSIAMAQFLGEFLISGFALELSRLFDANKSLGSSDLGIFWPASLLSLILSATLLIFARISDLYGGYLPFMFGVSWLTIWTLIPAFVSDLSILDVSRAMQGLAIAAFTPSTFVMVSSVYPDGPRKNFVFGLFSGCAPLGFFAGFLTAGALSMHETYWYFWIVAALSFVTAVTAYLSVPHDKTDRKGMGLKMDWLGAFLITAGLILVAYSLAVSTYSNDSDPRRNTFSYPMVYGPFSVGVVCLAFAIWVEGWLAVSPLMPFDFFRPRSVKAFCIAGLFFYATYGVWLYTSTQFFQSDTGTVHPGQGSGVGNIQLAIWYAPTAITGLVLCVISGSLLHLIHGKILLMISGLAWIAAPLLLAVWSYPVRYWSVVLPSMICATLGIDLTYTLSLVFMSNAEPRRYQGLCGAVCSILVNLGISFSLSISEMVKRKAETERQNSMVAASTLAPTTKSFQVINWTYRAAFLYATVSAAVGFTVCLLFIRISPAMGKKTVDEEQASPETPESEASTLVGEREEQRQSADSAVQMGEYK